MTSYRIAAGHNLTLGALFTLEPQPKSTGLQVTRRSYTGFGIVDEGLYTEWVWDVVESADLYGDILQDAAGLNTVKYVNVTIYSKNEIFSWRRYNGMAIRPEPVYTDYFPRLVLLIRDLVEIGL